MKNTLLILFTLISLVAHGQVAIIKDKDGFTNVRKEPKGDSEIIHKVLKNEVFWYGEDFYEENKEWVSVFVPKNDFSLVSTEPDHLTGYIHRSRLLPFEKMTPYQGADFQFEYVVQPFDSTGRVLNRYNGKWVTAVDGRKAWGTDGGLPDTQVEEIFVYINGDRVEISKVFYKDIFECANSFKVFKNGETYFVYQWNSDAAGAYELVWVLNKNGLEQRLVGTIL